MSRRDPLPGRRRTVVVYLVAIVVPSLVLLALSWQSVDRQRHAIASLTASNRLLSASRLASEVEGRVLSRAISCLRDPDLLRLAALVREPESVERMDDGRRLAASVVERHPIAVSVFVLDSAGLRYPYLQNPLPAAWPSPPGDARAADFRSIVERAERLEMSDGQYGPAAALYERGLALAASPRLKALVLSRLARCQAHLGRVADARRAWGEVARAHGDERDLAHQPFGLVGALELKAPDLDAESRAVIEAAYAGLTSGRWSLGANEADYFAGALEGVLGRTAASRPSTPFLDECRLARALEDHGLRRCPHLRRHRAPDPFSRLHHGPAQAFTRDPRPRRRSK